MIMATDYTYIKDLSKELEIPQDGILSRILLKNSQVNVTLFGFDAGQELSEHTAASPAIIQILQGEAALTIAGEERQGGPGTWIYLPARAPHSLRAQTPVIMLLILVKSPAGG
jgi:quercetin dioxygenase-like cupin family protein